MRVSYRYLLYKYYTTGGYCDTQSLTGQTDEDDVETGQRVQENRLCRLSHRLTTSRDHQVCHFVNDDSNTNLKYREPSEFKTGNKQTSYNLFIYLFIYLTTHYSGYIGKGHAFMT